MIPRLLIPALAAAALAITAAPAHAASGYCSPSGDQCYSAKTIKGAVHLLYGTFSFRGRIEACVTPPRGSATCKSFRLREEKGGIHAIDVKWSAHFPNRGKGTYRVRYRLDGSALGPAVTFRRRLGEHWPRGPGSLAGIRPEGETRGPLGTHAC